jgi:DMSO/TMAO reductase YedYZ molybdopterin-dependent catalytic subunit
VGRGAQGHAFPLAITRRLDPPYRTRSKLRAAVTRAKLDPHQFIRRIPLAPHQMQDRITRVEDAIVLCHLGLPRMAREDWSLAIDGLVARPQIISFADLLRYEKASVTSIHQCAGSPLAPNEPTQRVCNVSWAGTRLADILARCEPHPSAQFVWSTGADYGEFGGVSVDAYVKDLPIDRVGSDVLIAYEMNGEPLAAVHGFPARLVVPGFYGTNSVKWLTRMTLAQARAPGPFTTRWYNDPALAESGPGSGRTVPVWGIAPQSVIVAPAPDTSINVSRPIQIWGWAWADGGVTQVEVAVDDGDWGRAALEPASGRAWQRFTFGWTPSKSGPASLASRARNARGECQPVSGRRNGIYRVAVKIT